MSIFEAFAQIIFASLNSPIYSANIGDIGKFNLRLFRRVYSSLTLFYARFLRYIRRFARRQELWDLTSAEILFIFRASKV